jgi:hypothetical protein
VPDGGERSSPAIKMPPLDGHLVYEAVWVGCELFKNRQENEAGFLVSKASHRMGVPCVAGVLVVGSDVLARSDASHGRATA